jgi:hypothetical protein
LTVALVMAAMLTMSAGTSLAQPLPSQSCTGIATANQQMAENENFPLKQPPGLPTNQVECPQ